MPAPFISFNIDLTDIVPTDVDIHDAARAVLDRYRQDVENDVALNVPSPLRPDIHGYATGAMQKSIESRVETLGTFDLRLSVSALVPHAGYADEGYTRKKGAKTAYSWELRGTEGHGGSSYMGKVAEAWTVKLGDEIVKEIAARRAQKEARRD